MTVITAVPKEHVGNVWQVVSPWLDKAIVRTHGRFHNVDILTSIIEGTASLWLALRDKDNGEKEIIGSLVFVVTIFPGGKKCGRIDYIAGRDRDDWFEEMWETIKSYSREQGCNAIEMIARPGTAAYVKRWGGKALGIYMEYDLEEKEQSHGRQQ